MATCIPRVDGLSTDPRFGVSQTESEKEFSQEVKSILDFVDVMPEEIPHGLPPMRNIQHQIDLIPSLVFPNKLASIVTPQNTP